MLPFSATLHLILRLLPCTGGLCTPKANTDRYSGSSCQRWPKNLTNKDRQSGCLDKNEISSLYWGWCQQHLMRWISHPLLCSAGAMEKPRNVRQRWQDPCPSLFPANINEADCQSTPILSTANPLCGCSISRTPRQSPTPNHPKQKKRTCMMISSSYCTVQLFIY